MRIGESGTEIAIARWLGKERRLHLDPLSSARLPQRLEGIGRAVGPGTADFILEPPIAQRRVLQGLPPVTPSALRALVQLNHGRFFRRNGHPLATGAAWSGAAPGRSQAIAVATEAGQLTPLLAALEQRGVQVRTVTVADYPRIPLTAPEWRRITARLVRRQMGTALALMAVVWMVAWGVILMSLLVQRRDLDALLTTATPVSRALAAVEADAAVLRQAVESLSMSRARSGDGAAAIHAVLQALPDSTYLTRLDWSAGGAVTLEGRRPDMGSMPGPAIDALATDSVRVIDGAPDGGVGVPFTARFVVRGLP